VGWPVAHHAYIPQRVVIANRRGTRWRLLWSVPLALALWALWAVPLVAALAVLLFVRSHVADLPAVPDLDAWMAALPQTSRIRAADGSVLAEIPFRAGELVGHRTRVRFDELPPRLVQAVLAAEDTRFFRHDGVDVQSVVRAAVANYRAGSVVEGASTITQQVARNLLPEDIGRARTLRRKIREAVLAWRIERRHDKARILEVYVNDVFLGAGAYGVAAAARAYFSRPLAALDLAEVALIAGLAQAPGRADPFKDLAAARARRDQVLERMARAGFVSASEAAAAAGAPVALSPPPARYGTLAPWDTERARREIETGMRADYRRGGLEIETAAQPVLAMAAAREARAFITRMGGRERDAGALPQVGALVWDHVTGYVEATIGGRDFEQSRFDRATQACRQPGSAFKPIVYAAAIEQDAITPGTPLRDAPIAVYDLDSEEHWKPRSSRTFRGVVLAQDALAASLNPPAVDVLDRVGFAPVVDLARRLGITSRLAEVRPLALGASCVVPLELAGAFAVFARQGTRVEPVYVVRVRRGDEVLLDRASPRDPALPADRRLDRMLEVLVAPRRDLRLPGARNEPQAAPQAENDVAPDAAGGAGPGTEIAMAASDVTGARALDPASAFLISDMLADVVRRGTGTDARRLGRPVAGKTGTTNDNTDAWFAGYTGRVVAVVWVGHDDPRQTLGARQDGAHAALPLWMDIVRLAEDHRPARPLTGEPPPGLERARVDQETGLLARPGAGGAVELWFKSGTAPTQEAGQLVDLPADLGRLSREF
jgi:penicillin-binding protein 1A